MVAIADVDTRRLTQLIREKGALNGCIVASADRRGQRYAVRVTTPLNRRKRFPGLKGMDLAKEVTGPQRPWTQTSWELNTGYGELTEPKYKVVAYDFGVKRNISAPVSSAWLRSDCGTGPDAGRRSAGYAT